MHDSCDNGGRRRDVRQSVGGRNQHHPCGIGHERGERARRVRLQGGVRRRVQRGGGRAGHVRGRRDGHGAGHDFRRVRQRPLRRHRVHLGLGAAGGRGIHHSVGIARDGYGRLWRQRLVHPRRGGRRCKVRVRDARDARPPHHRTRRAGNRRMVYLLRDGRLVCVVSVGDAFNRRCARRRLQAHRQQGGTGHKREQRVHWRIRPVRGWVWFTGLVLVPKDRCRVPCDHRFRNRGVAREQRVRHLCPDHVQYPRPHRHLDGEDDRRQRRG